MGIREPGLPKGTLREKDAGQGYASPCPQVSLQRLRQSVLYTDRNQEILPVLSVRQSWVSKGTEMAACAGTKRPHLPNLRQHFHTYTVGCQVLLQCLPPESLQGERYRYRKVSACHLSVSVTEIRRMLQLLQVDTLTTCDKHNEKSGNETFHFQ